MKKTLQVSLRVSQPSVVELTVADRVQLDRLVPSPDGGDLQSHRRQGVARECNRSHAPRFHRMAALREVLELDTADCERPMVWTNTGSWWSGSVAEPADH
jgi:hypothetical protein